MPTTGPRDGMLPRPAPCDSHAVSDDEEEDVTESKSVVLSSGSLPIVPMFQDTDEGPVIPFVDKFGKQHFLKNTSEEQSVTNAAFVKYLRYNNIPLSFANEIMNPPDKPQPTQPGEPSLLSYLIPSDPIGDMKSLSIVRAAPASHASDADSAFSDSEDSDEESEYEDDSSDDDDEAPAARKPTLPAVTAWYVDPVQRIEAMQAMEEMEEDSESEDDSDEAFGHRAQGMLVVFHHCLRVSIPGPAMPPKLRYKTSQPASRTKAVQRGDGSRPAQRGGERENERSNKAEGERKQLARACCFKKAGMDAAARQRKEMLDKRRVQLLPLPALLLSAGKQEHEPPQEEAAAADSSFSAFRGWDKEVKQRESAQGDGVAQLWWKKQEVV